MITSMFLCAHRHGNLITRELAVGLCPFLSLVVRFGRSAAQILQNGPTQLFQWVGVGWGVGWDDNVHVPVRAQARQPHHTRAGGESLPLSLPGGPFWPLSSPNPPKRTPPAWSAWLCSLLSLLVVRFGRSAGPRQLGQLGCAPCSPSGGPFSPLSSPNPPKRTSPAWSAWLCSLLSLWWSVLAAQQLNSSKTDLASLVRLAVLLALWPLSSSNPPKRTYPAFPLGGGGVGGGVGWGGVRGLDNNVHVPVRTQARQPHHTRAGGESLPLSLPGGPFWPLSSPNPPKRTYPALPLGGGWGGVKGWDDNVHVPVRTQAGQPHHTRAGGESLPFLSLVVRFGRSAAQILQYGPRQLGLLGCALPQESLLEDLGC